MKYWKVCKLLEQLDIQNTEIPLKSLIDGRNKKEDPAEKTSIHEKIKIFQI